MSKQRYPEEFKTEAVKQITERGHKVADVSARLGMSCQRPSLKCPCFGCMATFTTASTIASGTAESSAMPAATP